MGRPRVRSDAEILDAAGVVISRVGPSRLTLAAVAREAGLSPAAILQRFGSKRQLLLAVADGAVRAPDSTVARVRSELPEASHLTVLRRTLTLMGEAVGDVDQLTNHFAFLQLDIIDADFRKRAVASMGALTTAVSELIEQAAATGEIVPRCTPRQLSDAIVSTWNGALITWAIFRHGTVDAWIGSRLDAVVAPHLA